MVEDALDRWGTVVAASSTGPSFLTQMRSGDHVLDLTHSHPSGLAQLLAGRGATRLSSLVREVGALADARSHARALREIAERQAEEIGLTTCHLGIGEATWLPLDGGEPLHAPVLVRPITLRLRGSAREDVELEIDATVDLNPVLLRALRDAGVAVDARALLATTDGPYGFDPNPVLDAFRALGEPLPGFRISHALVVGNLMDAVDALGEDLRAGREDWVEHDLVAALAGDAEARERLGAQREPQTVPVAEEELVAAVDPDHHRALTQVLGGQHQALTVPPGTSAVGLVVDLMAELIARGRSVLVVSQRRRSLSQIVALAEERGLGSLLFDLSPDPSLQRNASEALLTSLRGAGSVPVAPELTEPTELAEARRTLMGHVEAMHRVQQPWGVSAHEAISALADLTRRRPAPRTTVRLPAEVAAGMVGPEREAYAAQLREAAEVGALSTGPEDTAWFGATIATDTQARRALELVEELWEALLPRLQERAASLGAPLGLREVDSVVDIQDRLALCARTREVLDRFQPAVFTAPLDQLIDATGDAAWRARHCPDMPWGTRRRLRRQALELQRAGAQQPDPHTELIAARRVRDAWREQSAERARTPRVPERMDLTLSLAQRTQTALDELAVLLGGAPAGGDLVRTAFPELQELLAALTADADSLQTLPRHTTVLRRLRFDGLGELVEDLRSRRVSAERVADELELAWWRSVLELIAGTESTISEYDGPSLSRVAETFRRLDAAHLAESGHRVRRVADDVLVSRMKRFPDTSRAAIAELSRASTTSVRDLAAKYEDILFRARPAWLASPYLVPQIVPRGTHFDVVIVADGGRLPTWAALTAIVRARQTVVVGDPLEYAGQMPSSLLDDVREIAVTGAVRRDPHPASGGLRAFAQRRAGGPAVVAVPRPEAEEPDRLVLVDDARGPVTPGAEYVESTEKELRRVTDLVIEHARTRPERSLAVIALTPGHARAVMERVMATVGVVPMLRSFFDPDAEEFFTVVPAEHAASVTRDDVIVSLGFGMTPHGRLIHNFGPLSGPAGRKALVTALTRARGRTTVLSALRAEDLDVSRLRSDGTRDLHDLLSYLYTGVDPLLEAEGTGAEADERTSGGTTAAPAETAPSEVPSEGADAEEPGLDEGDAAPQAAASQDDTAAAAATQPMVTEVADADTPADGSDAAGPGQADSDTAATEPRDAEPLGVAAAEAGGEDPATADGDTVPATDTPEHEASTDEATAESAAEDQEPESAPAQEIPRVTAADALVADLADRLWRLGLVVDADFGMTEDRIELALGHRDLPGRYLVAVDTDGPRYVATTSQRERDRLRAERLEAAGWHTERVWSWALFIDPEGEAERIRRSVERALTASTQEAEPATPRGIASVQHRLPHPQIPAGQPLSFYATEDFDAVVEYICSDGRARLEDQLASEVRTFLGFERRSVLLDVAVASAIRRYQERL